MRIVVTGGSGNIGRALVRHFVEQGHEVLNLDRQRPRADAPGSFLFTDLARRDVLEPRLVDFAPDACCHLGEIPNPHARAENEVYGLNAISTGVVLQTLAEIGVKRIAYASSCQVYAQFGRMWHEDPILAPAALPMDESEPMRPNNGYGAQKAGAELYLASLARRFDLTACALRIPGCRDYVNSDSLGRWFRYRGDVLDEYGAWLDSADCASAFSACVTWEGKARWQGYEAFNVAADEAWRTPESAPVAERLAMTHPHFPKLPADFPAYAAPFSSEKIRRLLGWRPQVSMQQLFAKAELT